MITFKELKDVCNESNGNLFYGKDEVGCYYADKEQDIVVLDVSDGWHDEWVHESAKEIISNLCDNHNDVSCAEDDWKVIVDCCEFVDINTISIENGNVVCQ